MAPHRGHLFYIDPYRENFKNLHVWKQKAQAFDIWYIAFTYWTSTKIIQDIALGPKMAPLRGRHVLHRLT